VRITKAREAQHAKKMKIISWNVNGLEKGWRIPQILSACLL
jgi:hypothetical protein